MRRRIPKRRPLVRRLLPPFLIIAAFSLAGVAWLAVHDMTRFYYQEKSRDLEAMAMVAASQLESFIPVMRENSLSGDLQKWCVGFAGDSSTRVTIVQKSGTVLCDSERDPAKMNDHSDRPEIIQALAEGSGISIRYSYTLESNLMYVAVPLSENRETGVIRVAVPLSTMKEALSSMRVRLATGAFLAVILVTVLTLFFSQRITAPLKEMRRGAERIAGGDFSARLPLSRIEEFANLSEEMNRMAAQLDDRIQTVVNKRNELEAVLTSMVEGVLAFDPGEKIISMNKAAAELLDVDPSRVHNRTIHETVRNADLQNLVSKTLSSPDPVEDEFTLYRGGERYLQAHGTPLHDTVGQRIGALVVLNDVTNIRRLENIRRDFVANASHEIRTPITSIKGFVETLLDGAVEDPETTHRFLVIIKKHSDRLNAIVEDLLNLSKIEEETERGEIFLEEGSLREVVEEVVEACHAAAEKKQIILSVECPGDLKARINTSLLVQAVINLVDNAIKYSDSGGEVTIRCRMDESGKLILSVEDRGAGIEKKDIPRLFERFYRVDKARSRKMGGTGLGLSIVKHIVQVHGGEITVESRPGKGSTFSLHLAV